MIDTSILYKSLTMASTGVYAGVASSGNGNSDDLTNLDNTFLRGIVQTDVNGVAQYETIFPGHYTSRKSFRAHPHTVTRHIERRLISISPQAQPTSTSSPTPPTPPPSAPTAPSSAVTRPPTPHTSARSSSTKTSSPSSKPPLPTTPTRKKSLSTPTTRF